MKNEKQIDEILAEVKIRLMKENEPVNDVWYKYTNSELHKVRFTNIENREGYGIYERGFGNSVWSIENLTPMTEIEIYDMLKNHAIKLGFKIGVTVDRSKLNIPDVLNIKANNFEYNVFIDVLYLGGNAIYKQGILADIVTEKTSEEWVNLYYKQSCTIGKFMDICNLELKQKK